MHSVKPTGAQRRGKKRGTVWIAVLVVLLIGGGAAWYWVQTSAASASAAAQAAEETHTTTVRRGNIRVSVSGSGKLAAGGTTDLAFPTQGTLAEVAVKTGDTVHAGDLIARLGNAEDLQANAAALELELLEAQQALDNLTANAGAALAQAYKDWTTAQQTYSDAADSARRSTSTRCGADVNKRNLTALERTKEKLETINPSDVGSDAWINAKSEYDTAQANYTYCIGFSSDEQNTINAELDLAAAGLAQAEEKYNTLNAASGIDPDELALAERKVSGLEIQLAGAKSDLDGIVMKAPSDGRVISLAARQGEMVDSSVFATLADVSRMTVELSVDENAVASLTLGSTAEVIFDALPDQVFYGKLVKVEPQLTTSGPYQVATGLVEMDRASLKVLSMVPLGLNCSVEIISQEAKDTLLVPLTALKDLGDGEYAVLTQDSTGKMRLKTVAVGIRDTSFAQIVDGLEAGEIVTTGITQTASED